MAAHELFSCVLRIMRLISFVYIATPKIFKIILSALFGSQKIVLLALIGMHVHFETPCNKLENVSSKLKILKIKIGKSEINLVSVWPNGRVFVYELSGSGLESSCCHLNFRFHACFKQGVP